jgi:CAAX prenyl protease-like protein
MPWYQRYRWLPFVLPLAVYMLVVSIEPTSPEKPGGAMVGLSIPYDAYPWVYLAKIVLTAAALAVSWPAYRQFPWRLGWLGVAVGVVGIVAWVGLCSLGVERNVLVPALQSLGVDWLISSGQRSGFNPFEQYGSGTAAWLYLALRFTGLVAVVPLVEEIFYRGFLMRFLVRDDWWDVPQGDYTAASAAIAIILPALMHPAELLAAIVYFSLVTWLYIRTRNVWECVAAHATTNLLLGAWVLVAWWFDMDQWHYL